MHTESSHFRNESFARTLVKSLRGERGHIPIKNAIEDIDWELSGKQIENIPYSIYQLLKHMIYWQDFLLLGLQGEKPQLPTDVKESWPVEHMAKSQEEWEEVIEQFLSGVDTACTIAQTTKLDEDLAQYPDVTRADTLRNIASHNSYHLGEIVLLRRLLEAWPPPSGGYPI
ncbi:DinB family protein [Bacillus sp. DX4.1]|uniref:DinB family protein n=1 Tax=Bacillus sp. DX4.1 TaxID=3055867 RepID=UPI0025A05037|nr:DinB family protein [Bacillus sp. DX4.1]MDM5189582.1 DinB family protein [Bacillus sp. DX4.1]